MYYMAVLIGATRVTNTIEPSICGSDAALCQITLTTCFILQQFSSRHDSCACGL